MFEYVKANQAVVITPFLLMGAMSPVSLPATLVQQVAEALAGIALAQLIRPGAPVVFGSVPVQHRHAVGLAVVRHARVGHRRAVHRPDRPALRPALARRRRPQRVADRRRPGRVRVADDAAADVPGRHELRHALGRVARGRARVLLREVHRRRRAPARAPPRVHAARDRRGVAGVRRPHRGRARAGTSSAPPTRSSASASASTARCCPRPRTSTAGPSAAPRTPRRAPARSGARRSRATSSRRSTTRSAPSSRSSWCAGAPSSATDQYPLLTTTALERARAAAAVPGRRRDRVRRHDVLRRGRAAAADAHARAPPLEGVRRRADRRVRRAGRWSARSRAACSPRGPGRAATIYAGLAPDGARRAWRSACSTTRCCSMWRGSSRASAARARGRAGSRGSSPRLRRTGAGG